MKRLVYIAILVVAALAGCAKEPTLADKICGEWRGSELSADVGIYISFTSSGTFELYQKLTGDRFELRRGRWSLSGDILSGQYNDEEPLSASYKVSINGENMTLTAQNEDGEVSVYRKATIPQAIKTGSTVVVKSYSAEAF